MPGLRSLDARRRSSLPSTDTLLCSYSIPAKIPSRKGTSLDDHNRLVSESSNNDLCKENMDLFNFDGVNCEENSFGMCSNSDKTPISSFETNCDSKVLDYDQNCKISEVTTDSCQLEGNSPSLMQIDSDSHETDNDCREKEVSDRFIIRMKLHSQLLHDSLSDGSENDETVQNAVTSNDKLNSTFTEKCLSIESNYDEPQDSENASIYSIECNKENINNFHSNENSECTKIKEVETTSCCTQTPEEKVTSLYQDQECHSERESSEYHPILDSSLSQNIKSNVEIKLTTTQNNLIHNQTQNIEIEQRRSSCSSDVSSVSHSSVQSDDSVSSGSVKSCSIIIKRLKDSYSCVYSPKKKKNKYLRTINLKTLFDKDRISLSILRTEDSWITNFALTKYPCSVILCDIFSGYLLKCSSCSNCSNEYSIPKDIEIDIKKSTITFQCSFCDWLLIKGLEMKEIKIRQ